MNNRNLFATLAVVALLTVVATTAGCATNTSPSPTPTSIPATQTTAGNNTTFSSAAGFKITYPTILPIDTNENASVPVRVYIYPNPINKADGVVVFTYKLESGKTLDDFSAYNVFELKNYSIHDVYQNFTILNQTNTTLSGKPANTIVWTGVIPIQNNATSSTNTSMKVMQTYVINNGTGYTITYKAIPGDFDKYLPQAQKIMNSFVLT
jgi:eukaryotic-like serine/threonine-protein kinase